MTPQQNERAGLYILGLLDEADASRFATEMAADADLRSAVDRLQTRFTALDETATPVQPSANLWSRVENQLNAPALASASPERHPGAARAPMPAKRSLPPRLWLPMAASIVIALGVGYLAGTMQPANRTPVMIAVLVNDADPSPGAIVEAFADNSVRIVPLDRFEVPAGQILQAWTLPDAETGPVSLGTFSDPTAVNLTGPDLPPPQTGQLYEITLEPAPGSPTGRPTGPILVKGFAKAPV